MPRPRISRCAPIASDARPITRSPWRESSTASSATSRFPRAISSSAHSLLPAPLGPASSTPTPPTSTSTPWTRTVNFPEWMLSERIRRAQVHSRPPFRLRSASPRCARSARLLKLGVFFLDRVDHVLERLALREALAEGRIPEEPGDPRERLEVLPARVLRHHEQEEVVGGLTVDRLEIDARAAARKARDQPPEPGELPVGDGQGFGDSRALQRLALQQHVEQAVGFDLRLDLREAGGHLREHFALGSHAEIEDH